MSKSEITNWYTKIPKQKQKKDPTYNNHLIKSNSMICCVGGTGSGKSNALVEFLSRKNGQFFEIIIFTGSSKHEPLYDFLEDKIDGIKIIDDINELPNLDNYKESDKRDLEKLIVFDDSSLEDNKTLKQMAKFFMAGRKAGFTVFFLSQNYHSIPIFIRRQIHYLILFKLTDMRDVKNILGHHTTDIDLDTLKKILNHATNEKMNFLTIAVNDPPDSRYRHNFTEVLNPQDFKTN